MRVPTLAAMLVLLATSGVPAQSVTDGSGATIGPDTTRAVLALIAKKLRSPDAKVTALRKGRAGAICGAVEVRNRMGTYTGARGFVADVAAGFTGRLPDPAERRNPSSVADFQAMERASALFAKNCTAS